MAIEIDPNRQSNIMRCCDDPVPVTNGTHQSPNTHAHYCEVRCSSCSTLLVTFRWMLPAKAKS